MKFWDSSAVVPLLVYEASTKATQLTFREDSIVIVAWSTLVECASAIARAERDDLIDQPGATIAFSRLDDLARIWLEVEPTGDMREIARRLLRVHRLRAADALQLASATLAAERRPLRAAAGAGRGRSAGGLLRPAGTGEERKCSIGNRFCFL